MHIGKKTFYIPLLMLALFVGYMQIVNAGCRINYKFRNDHRNYYRSVGKFSVISKGGAWKNIKIKGYKAASVPPKSEIHDVYRATFGCKVKRRYRYEVCGKNIYYPSSTGWTNPGTSDIDFGDISRYCK